MPTILPWTDDRLFDIYISTCCRASFSVRLSATYFKLVLQYKPSGPICLRDNLYECDYSWNYIFFVTGFILFDVIMYFIWLSCCCQRCLLARIFLWSNSLSYTAILMSLKSCHHMYKNMNIYIYIKGWSQQYIRCGSDEFLRLWFCSLMASCQDFTDEHPALTS